MILRRFNVEVEENDALKIQILKAAGYVELHHAEEEPKVDIDSMTVKELHELAKAKGFSGASSLRKAELIELLRDEK